MRFGPDDTFWVVTDASPESELDDLIFQTSLRGLELQFKGGLTMAIKPTLFTEGTEARIEAYGRLVAMRASQVIARLAADGKALNLADRLEILDGDGKILFEADLR